MKLENDRIGIGSEMPAEAFRKLPIVEMLGNKRVLIESHRGVISYSGCEISVRTLHGTYIVRGCKLEIAKMTRFQLVITGSIESVSIFNGR